MTKITMQKYYLSFLLILALTNPCLAKTKKSPSIQKPGEILTQANGLKIIFEHNRSLLWPHNNRLVFNDASGTALFQVDLNAAGKKPTGAEAMGLEVEEADLGGNAGGKGYLRGKKQPKGRKLDPTSLSETKESKGQGKVSRRKVEGIPMTITEYPNGSYQLLINWGKTQEEVFFDRRHTLIFVEQRRKVSGLSYILKQWADGSFTRRYQQSSGEITYTFDTIGQSYRIVFANTKGETVAEAYCQKTCQLE